MKKKFIEIFKYPHEMSFYKFFNSKKSSKHKHSIVIN